MYDCHIHNEVGPGWCCPHCLKKHDEDRQHMTNLEVGALLRENADLKAKLSLVKESCAKVQTEAEGAPYDPEVNSVAGFADGLMELISKGPDGTCNLQAPGPKAPNVEDGLRHDCPKCGGSYGSFASNPCTCR